MTEPIVAAFYGVAQSRKPSSREVWDHWTCKWKARIADGRDLVIVIDADRTAGATRIGKSTLAILILRALDPTLRPDTIRSRVAGRASDLARFVGACERGQGILYDEGMWGARGRDAMTPDAKMIGEVLGTLASRGAAIVFCTHSMLSLDPEVKALAAFRLLVRRRGLAEVHTPQIQLDYERPRLLPFRQAKMSPLEWQPLDGPLWDSYLSVKRELQDAWIARKLEEQRVWEARRLGLSPRADLRAHSADGTSTGTRDFTRGKPTWDRQRKVRCDRCKSRVRADGLAQHRRSARCLAASGGKAE